MINNNNDKTAIDRIELLEEINNEYRYLKITQPTLIISNAFVELNQMSLRGEPQEVANILSDTINPHLELIHLFLDHHTQEKYELIKENKSLIVIDNISNSIRISVLYHEKLRKYQKEDARPFIYQIKYATENILNYFAMIRHLY